MTGEYKASSGAEISLNAMNVPRGSVVVTAGGMTLVENSDYIVDYAMGVVTILNQSIIESGTPISVSLENQSMSTCSARPCWVSTSTTPISKGLQHRATIMHLSEKPLTEKVSMGDEVLNNTLWGGEPVVQHQFPVAHQLDEQDSLRQRYGAVDSGPHRRVCPAHSPPVQDRQLARLLLYRRLRVDPDGPRPQVALLVDAGFDSYDAAYRRAFSPKPATPTTCATGRTAPCCRGTTSTAMFTQKTSSLIPAHLKNDWTSSPTPTCAR